MADLGSYGNAARDIEQALIALKKGAQLLKYGRKGKPKFYPFRLSTDNRDLPSNSPSNSSVSAERKVSSSGVSISSNVSSSPKSSIIDNSIYSERSHVALDQPIMQVKGSCSDAFRVSVSSDPSTSSHGSAPDDCDALGDVYIWGEVICDNVIMVGPEKNSSSISTKADVLLPRPLECNVVLDVHHIACGVRHAALVARQGEVFSWGEESGGRLGHGVGKDVTQPRLVESVILQC